MADPFLHDPVVLTPDEALQRQPAHAQDQLREGEAPETLLLTNAPSLHELLVDVLEADDASTRVGPVALHRSSGFEGVGLCHPGTGAPALALVAEKCIAAGTRRIFWLGFGAAIAPGADTGELCLVTAADPHDGLTSHYAAPGYEPEPDPGLTRTLREAAGPHREGVVWTIDAPYRQTLDALERKRERGVLAVDMEVSALFTVCAYRQVPTAAMLVTTDVIEGEDWEPCQPGAVDEAVRDGVRGLVAVFKGLRNLQS